MESHTEVSRLLETPERATEQRQVSVTPACMLTVAICSLQDQGQKPGRMAVCVVSSQLLPSQVLAPSHTHLSATPNVSYPL